MPQALQTRVASLGASALLLGAAFVAAVSMRYVIEGAPVTLSDPAFEMIERPEIAPPRTAPEIRLPTTSQEEAITTLPPMTPQEVSAEPTTIAFTGPPSVVTMTDPDWIERPRDLERYYPRRAMRMGIEASVTLDCLVGTDGRLSCTVLSESPPNWGFGEAAQRIASEHRMRPATRDGQAVEARYVMRVPFTLQ
ncbi:periplasmic binding protein tonB [alpha proteobacterium U9-1i]|nr:periplasmic binding protein tonB [alpha proteobacterium U9-1i]